jgi:cytochrome c oxidase subunit 4
MSVTATAAIDSDAQASFLREERKRYFTFMNLAFLMTGLTGIELVLIYLPFPSQSIIYFMLIILSLIKFLGVIFWFMHLLWDKAFLTIVFLFGMLIASGTIAALLLLFNESFVDPAISVYETE